MSSSVPAYFDSQEDQLITTKEAAGLLGVSKAFLDRDRWAGKINGQGGVDPLLQDRGTCREVSAVRHHLSHKLGQAVSPGRINLINFDLPHF